MTFRLRLLALGVLHVAILFAAVPISPWEFDEPLFFQALQHYDPLAHHPPPPGYPIFIMAGQLVRLFAPSDFTALAAISFVASTVGFVFLALAFRKMTGDASLGALGAILFYVSPAMLVHSTLPISEPGALMLFAIGLYFAVRAMEEPEEAPATNVALFAAALALAVGWRIQFSIAIVPLFLTAVLLLRGWTRRIVALLIFTMVCLMWLARLAAAVGGFEELIDYERRQGEVLAAHDADESRTGWTPVRIAFRFIGRPWGDELTAMISLAFGALGFIVLMRSRWRMLLPLIAGAGVYIAVALLVMDPADGVRYAIPFVLATALFVAAGIEWTARRVRLPAFALAVPLAVAFIVYVAPILTQRRTIVSPPVRAAAYAREAFPPNAVALYELPLWPHATYFLRDRAPHRVDDGLARFFDRPDVPLFIYADGATRRPDAKVFQWRNSDAYEKLTRNHYRASSIIPVPPERRYRIISGIYAPEREQDGHEWRWLSSPAELQLPRGPERDLTLHVGLSPRVPLAANELSVSVNGNPAGNVRVEREKRTTVTVKVPAGSPVIRVDAATTFVPAEVPELRSGDRRRLSVELYELVTSPASAPLAPRPSR